MAASRSAVWSPVYSKWQYTVKQGGVQHLSRQVRRIAKLAPSCCTGARCSHVDGESPAELSHVSASPPDPSRTVTVTFQGRQVRIGRGAKMRSALLKNGLSPHNGQAQLINCRGLGTCGTCAVAVEGCVAPAAWNAQERLRLNFPPHSPPGNQALRLACQVRCEGNLQVTKYSGFWGQGECVVEDGNNTNAQLPFGKLEFLLDPDSQE